MASNYFAKGLKRSALTVALGLCVAGGVQAQSTQGSVFGTVAGGENATVVITNNSGMTRTATTDESGSYRVGSLPVGEYTVTVSQGGQVVGTREITVLAGAGSNVSFGDATTLGTVTVTAGAIPPIDITAVDSRSILTAQQLERLPVAHDAEAIALMAPGAVQGAGGYFGGLVSFGGAGVSENAYYVNGYFTGEPLSNLGGFTLPYGAIEQQETYIGGYQAMYGRSAGGVINQVGKRGTNEWQFGGQVVFVPESLKDDQVDRFYPDIDLSGANSNPALPTTCGAGGDELCQWEYSNPSLNGTLYSRGSESESSSTTYSAYVGGPIIQDRLFFFAAAEAYKSDASSAPTAAGSTYQDTEVTDPKIYAKIDWNITNNHFLELTYMGEKYDSEGVLYDYDFDTAEVGDEVGNIIPVSQNSEYFIGKYTGYLTDNLTFSATYGRSRFSNVQIDPEFDSSLPYLSGTANQDPSITGGTRITNGQSGYRAKDSRDYTEGLRADLEYLWGDHTFTLGIDNIEFNAENEGTSQIATVWIYGAANPATNLAPAQGVGAPGGDGYYVTDYKYFTSTSMSLEQKAWYVQDEWQVTDNFLLSLGIRNDQFTNKNNFGETYMEAKDQWAPRIGFSWDVMGDSSLKVFGNAGRYFLALPNNVAIRGASASTYTREYFTYTGIDANGTPTGLTPVPGVDGAPPPGPVSANGETGGPVDVLAFSPSDLENLYQDEYILGFEKQLTPEWMLGMKLTQRNLKSSVDDICDPYTLMDVHNLTIDGEKDGKFLASSPELGRVEVNYCYMFNPGGTNTFSFANVDADGNYTGERSEAVMTSEDWGFTDGLKRTYNGLDIYLERPFDGKWEARIDYTFSKLEGNNEGQVKSEFGQDNISKTQDWDAWQIMQYGVGYLANDRRHQLKARGSYQITDEWSVGANLRIMSGMPISCLGYFNPDGSMNENEPPSDPISYGSSYHTCFGEIASPGAVRTPWTRKLDVGLTYRPLWADQKLALSMQVFNVTNEREVQQVDVTSENDPYIVSNTYMLPISLQTPRYVMFTASYDW